MTKTFYLREPALHEIRHLIKRYGEVIKTKDHGFRDFTEIEIINPKKDITLGDFSGEIAERLRYGSIDANLNARAYHFSVDELWGRLNDADVIKFFEILLENSIYIAIRFGEEELFFRDEITVRSEK